MWNEADGTQMALSPFNHNRYTLLCPHIGTWININICYRALKIWYSTCIDTVETLTQE
jgi:hypothetical protein